MNVFNSKRKSKCDGNTPACAACSQVYGTACIYHPQSDHRRKGVYKNDIDNLKTRNTTLQTIIQAMLNYEEDNAFDLVREIRTCESLDAVAEKIVAKERGVDYEDEEDEEDDVPSNENGTSRVKSFETQLCKYIKGQKCSSNHVVATWSSTKPESSCSP